MGADSRARNDFQLRPRAWAASLVLFLSALAAAQAPQISSIGPSVLTPGSQATITGSGFGDDRGRGFVSLWNAWFAPVVSWSDTSIVVMVPSRTRSGRAFVFQNGAWSNGVAFTVAGSASLNAGPLNFGNVTVGQTDTMPEAVTNVGSSAVTIVQATATGAGFAFSGLTTPQTLNPGDTITFQVTYTPAVAGTGVGTIMLATDGGLTLPIALAGTGQGGTQAAGSLTVTPATADLGSVTVGTVKTIPGTLSASSGSVVISSASTTSPEFTLPGLTLPLTIAAGQSTSFTIQFAPQASGAASASITFASNALNPPTVETLTGAGVAAAQHSVSLNWQASPSTVTGYNVYRGTQTGGPYTKMTTSPEPATTFTDSTVQAGQTYFYVVTALDPTGTESTKSNEVQAAVPTP